MELALGWVILSVLVGMYAGSKGRSSIGFFLLATILSPLIAFIIALVVSENRPKAEEKKISNSDLRKCPFCAELIKSEAIVCRYCGRDLPSSEPAKDKPADPPEKGKPWEHV